MNLKKTNTGQVVFEQDLTGLDINKIELRCRSKDSSDLIRRFHGYVPSTSYVGRQLNYSIWCEGEEIGFTGIGSAIMAMKGRDDFIGWNKQQRMEHTINIANNWRYTLINNLPPNTGSKVLMMVSKRSKIDWKKRYGDELVMLETLVEAPRTGAVYIAAGWKCVGNTLGTQYEWKDIENVLSTDQIARRGFRIAGKVDENKVKVISGSTSSKMIFVKPINKRWKKILCESPKCEECVNFFKYNTGGCDGCDIKIVRSRLYHYNVREQYTFPDDVDSLPFTEYDGKPWRL